MRRSSFVVSAFATLALACGPNSGGGDNSGAGVDGGGGGGADGSPSELVTIQGTVWVPGNAPGMVPAGQEIPVSNAHVYVSANRPAPVDQTAHCQSCVDVPDGTFTDASGHFSLQVVPNTYWLVIQKGQFRLEQQFIAAANQTYDLPAEQTTLPSVHDPDAGKWVPRIALASGVYDHMESILGKMGLGEVDGTGKFVANSAAGNFDVYGNGGALDSVAVGSLTDLVSDLNTMMQYHIIFIPCASSGNAQALQDEQVLHNIRDYVNAGGKLYVTDWSGEWEDNVFPAQVTLYDGGFSLGSTDTPADAFNPTTESWNTSMFGDADGSPSYTSDHAEAVDQDLHDWLDRQSGPRATGGEGAYDAGDFDITGNWNHIEGLSTVTVGTDDMGNPVEDVPKIYIQGDDGLGGAKKPLTVTFEPTGCGRVLYSTYHTTEGTHVGLVPQERVLLYLIMEIGECKSGPIVN